MLLVIAVALAAAAVCVVGFVVKTAVWPFAPRVRPGRIKVAAIGDSNTWGAGAGFRGRRSTSYPARLQALLGDAYQVLNYGLSGRTLLSTGDFPFGRNSFARISTRIHPDIVLIMLGTNDSKPRNWDAARFGPELVYFVDRYARLPGPPRIFLITPPVAFANSMKIDPDVIREQVAPTIRRVGEAIGVPVIDVFAATDRALRAHPDGVHPDAAGLDLIARVIHESIGPGAASA
jgi:acyl-CoA thioesterase I